MINKGLIDRYKKEYLATTGRELLDDLLITTPPDRSKDLRYWEEKVCNYYGIRKLTRGDRVLTSELLPYKWFIYLASNDGHLHVNIASYLKKDRSTISMAYRSLSLLKRKKQFTKRTEWVLQRYNYANSNKNS